MFPSAKAKKNARRSRVARALVDTSVPPEARIQMLRDFIQRGSSDADKLVAELLDMAAASGTESEYRQRLEEVRQLLRQMQLGPQRLATFIGPGEQNGTGCRAIVSYPEGGLSSCLVPEPELAARLRTGDPVWVEPHGNAVLGVMPGQDPTGEVAVLEQRVGDDAVEVSLRGSERFVYRCSAHLLEQLERGEAALGGQVLVCQRRAMAFRALPARNGLARFTFLEQKAPPDVVVERDIGAPPAFIGEMVAHVSGELRDPDRRRRYGLNRCCTKLLHGVSGCGKTQAIDALWRSLYVEMSVVTGVPIEKLPPRVMRLSPSRVLSQWFGQSEQNIARFFDEVEQLADLPFTTPDGRQVTLPVFVIVEEAEALGRRRGGDQTYDRVESTVLQRMDITSSALRDKLVVMVATTNVPDLLDPAFRRRAGATSEQFGRLGRAAFRAVLKAHLHSRPFSTRAAADEASARRHAMDVLQDWLFAVNGADEGLLEVRFVGSAAARVFQRRDFLTGGLVAQAVQQAAAVACDAEDLGGEHPGLDVPLLARAIETQVSGVADILRPDNASQYLSLPDDARVASVHRLESSPVLPFELELAS